MMMLKEAFIKLYEQFLAFEDALETVEATGIYLYESQLSNAFYGMLDGMIPYILDPEGCEILYSSILYNDISTEVAVKMLEGHFLDNR